MKTNKKQSIIALASIAIAILLILIPSSTLAAEELKAKLSSNVTGGSLPLTVNFADQSTGNINGWKWEFGDGTTSNSKSPALHTYYKPKAYKVKLTVYDAYGNSNSSTSTITVKQQNLEAKLSSNVTGGSLPLTVNFADQSTGNINGWKWEFGDGTTSNSKSPEPHTYYKPKAYKVKLTVYDAYGNSNSSTSTITVVW